jgi:hypothetical protein
MLLFPPDARTLNAGEATGITLALDGEVPPGTYVEGSYFFGMFLTVPGPNNMMAGSYSINARDARGNPAQNAVATMRVRMITPPVDGDNRLTTIEGSYCNATITSSAEVQLAPGLYDVVRVP